jgi:hypothetical protein
VLRLDVAVVGGKRHALGIGDGLLELGGQLVESHGVFPSLSLTLSGTLGGNRAISSAIGR